MVVRVIDHLLEGRPFVGPCGHRPVDVFVDDVDSALLSKRRALSNLTLNGLFPLVVRRIAGIDDGCKILCVFHTAKILLCVFACGGSAAMGTDIRPSDSIS